MAFFIQKKQVDIRVGHKIPGGGVIGGAGGGGIFTFQCVLLFTICVQQYRKCIQEPFLSGKITVVFKT